MNKFFKTILQNQGYEHIGIIDEGKKIWGYAKENLYHFCKEDLTDVDRKDIGIDHELLAITEIIDSPDNKIVILKDNQICSNYLILDESNKIIRKWSSYDKSSKYQFWRINSNSFIIGEEKFLRGEAKWFSSDSGFRRYEIHQDIFIDGKEEDDYNLCGIKSGLYLFAKVFDNDNPVEGPGVLVYNETECLYKGDYLYVWNHLNGETHFLSTIWNDDKSETLLIIYNSSSGSYKMTREVPSSCKLNLYDIELFNDNNLLIPYRDNRGVLVVRCGCGEKYLDIKSHPIFFYRDGFAPDYFSDNIITRKLGWRVFNECHIDGLEFYDIFGNYLELLKDPYNCPDKYYIFSVQNKCLFHNIDRLYGVLEIWDNRCERVIIPPVFENIEELSYGIFKVQYGNYLNECHNQIEFLFSVVDGILNGTPVYLKYIIGGAGYYPNNEYKKLAFMENGYWGLLFNGQKVLDATFDNIQGFNYIFYFHKEITDKDAKSIVEGYGPRCAILNKRGKHGLFIGGYDSSFMPTKIMVPIYDSIRCVMVTVGEYNSCLYFTYFEVRKGDQVGIISDHNNKFNEYFEIGFDRIEAIHWCYWVALFLVYKNGRVGAISSLSPNDNGFIIPIKYNELSVEWVGRKQGILYCGDGTYYIENEKALISKENYVFERCDSIGRCFVFKSRFNKSDYLFFSLGGNKFEACKIDNDDNLLLVNSTHKFDVSEGHFLIEKKDEDSEYDYSSYNDDYDYEKDVWFAMTDGQYGDMPDDFDDDYDFTGH